MELLIFLLIGGIAGWAAGEFMKGHGFGLLGNIVVGVIGAFIGGFLFTSMGVAGGGMLGAILTAMVGSVILLFLVGLIKRA